MKIKSVRTAKNVVACLMALDMFATGMVAPPFKKEENYELVQSIIEEDKDLTRKLVKRKNPLYINTLILFFIQKMQGSHLVNHIIMTN